MVRLEPLPLLRVDQAVGEGLRLLPVEGRIVQGQRAVDAQRRRRAGRDVQIRRALRHGDEEIAHRHRPGHVLLTLGGFRRRTSRGPRRPCHRRHPEPGPPQRPHPGLHGDVLDLVGRPLPRWLPGSGIIHMISCTEIRPSSRYWRSSRTPCRRRPAGSRPPRGGSPRRSARHRHLHGLPALRQIRGPDAGR